MELSILVAKIMTILYLGIGIGMVTEQATAKKMLKDFVESPGLTMMSGFLMVVLGVLLVQNHNIWTWSWTVLVTIIAWAVLIKGFLFLASPKCFLEYSQKYGWINQKAGYVVIVISLIFGYFGFIA